MKVSTLEAKATEILLKSKEEIALERLLKTNEEISRMEAALNLLTYGKPLLTSQPRNFR